MTDKRIAYFQLHIAVILYGLTAILGDLISISAVSLVWWRVLITSLSLIFFINYGKSLFKLDKGLALKFFGIGAIIAVHWITFYGAIKLSNASIVLAAMATTSLFTSIVEPIVTGKSFQKLELILGLLVIPPMLLIANNIEFNMMDGLLVGLLSAFLAAVFASFNKLLVDKASPYEISFLEMFSAFIVISCVLPFLDQKAVSFWPQGSDWLYLIILSLLCTTLAFVISMMALKKVSAFDANLVVNLEPVYGIFLAILILKEHQEMSPHFYWGVLLILLVVFSHPFLKKKFNE